MFILAHLRHPLAFSGVHFERIGLLKAWFWLTLNCVLLISKYAYKPILINTHIIGFGGQAPISYISVSFHLITIDTLLLFYYPKRLGGGQYRLVGRGHYRFVGRGNCPLALMVATGSHCPVCTVFSTRSLNTILRKVLNLGGHKYTVHFIRNFQKKLGGGGRCYWVD